MSVSTGQQEFSAILQHAMTSHEVGVRETARRANLQPAQVSRVLTGKRRATPRIVVRLAAALGASPNEWLAAAGHSWRVPADATTAELLIFP